MRADSGIRNALTRLLLEYERNLPGPDRQRDLSDPGVGVAVAGVPEEPAPPSAVPVWVCYPTADEAPYGWGDPYPGPVPPLGTPQTSWDITKHVGALMYDDGTLASLASNDIATPQDWRAASPSKVVLSWTAQGIYAAGIQVLAENGIRCAALRSMADGGVAKTYLLWIGLNTSPVSFVLRAREVSVDTSTGVVTIVGATTYQWALSSNVAAVGLQGTFWSFSADASKLAFTHISTRTSYEATGVPEDVSSTVTLPAAAAFQDGTTQFSYTSTSEYSGSRQYLLRSDYVGNDLTPIYLELAYSQEDIWRDTQIRTLSAGTVYWIDVDGGRWTWVDENDTTTRYIFYHEQGPEKKVTASLIVGVAKAAEEDLFHYGDFFVYYSTNTTWSDTLPPYEDQNYPKDYSTFSQYSDAHGVSGILPGGIAQFLEENIIVRTCQPFLLDPAWQSARFNRVVYAHFGENDESGAGFHCGNDPLTTYDFELRIAGDIARVVNFGGDYGSFNSFDPVTTPPQTQGDAESYLGLLYSKLVTAANGSPSYGVTAALLNLDNAKLVYCVGASNNDASGNREWKSYLNDTELTAGVGISGYTDPKMLYESGGAPQWSFGILRLP